MVNLPKVDMTRFPIVGGDMHRAPIWAILTAVAACGSGRAVPTPGPLAELAPAIEMPRAILSDVPFVSLEGPFWVREGGYLLFSDVAEKNDPAAKIYRYDPPTGRFSVLPYPGGPISTNGLAVDGQGHLLACERWNGALARISLGQERRAVLAERSPQGRALNAPNDLALRADGNIYFSDSNWGARPGKDAPTAVYRLSPAGQLSVALSVSMPNGIALAPDAGTLYVGSDTQDRLWRLALAADGTPGPAQPFGDSGDPRARLHVPDGLCVDDRGRVYVTNNSDDVRAIIVLDRDGSFVGRIPFPVPPSNCSFGAADRRTIFVTTGRALYQVRVDTPGLP
jgi:gluconolactonase